MSVSLLPLIWLVCFLPHGYAIIVFNTSTRWRGPAAVSHLAALADRKLAHMPEVYGRIVRAEAAYSAGIQHSAYFTAAVIAANQVQIDFHTLNSICVLYLLNRMLHNDVYIFCKGAMGIRIAVTGYITELIIICTLSLLAGSRLR